MMQYEIYKETVRELTLETKDGALENKEEAISSGIAVRVIKDGRLGFSYSTDPKASIEGLLRLAEEISGYTEADSSYSFPAKGTVPLQKGTVPLQKGDCPLSDKISMLFEVESSALAYSKKVRSVRKAAYQEFIRHVEIKNSLGLEAKYSHGFSYIQAVCVAENGNETEWAFEEQFSLDPKKLMPRLLGQNIAYRATALLGGKKIRSCKSHCILDRRVAAQFLEFMSSAFFADSVLKNRSPFKKPSGRIYSKNITIVEDPSMQAGYSSVPYDSEGSASKKTVVVKQGILRSFLTDSFYANKMGIENTASFIKTSIMAAPRIGIRNFHILPGKLLPEEMEKKMGRGLVVTNVMGLHTANQVTGDFSLGASGFWVEDGVHAYPVKGITIAGNLHELLGRVEDAGFDQKFWLKTGAPSLLVDEITVSGS